MSKKIREALFLFAALSCALSIWACGDGGEDRERDPIITTDASTPLPDAAVPMPDGGPDLPDASADPDSGVPDEPAQIEWCRLVSPMSAELEVGGALMAYAQVYAIGRTEGDYREDSGVKGQLGIGNVGSDPRTDSGWTWIDASHNANFADDSGNHDEYMATHAAQAAGTYAYAFRFQVDAGAWFYCDTDGHSATNEGEGFSAEMLGRLTVAVAGQYKVGWCNLQNSARTISTLGRHLATSQVYVAGLTERDKAGSPLIEAELGVGAKGSDPRSDAGWTWQRAAINDKADAASLGNNSEYMGELAGLQAGQYAFAFRYKANGDEGWLYCDSDGHSAASESEDFSAEKLGELQVLDPSALSVGWCQLQGPSPAEISAGQDFTAYGQVLVAGLTGTANGFLDDPAIVAQLGVVETGDVRNYDSDPSAWTDARVNATPASDLGQNSEYMATVSGLSAGSYSFAYRFKIEGAAQWTYCDLTNGYRPELPDFLVERQGSLTVTAVP